jgi:hypothetical protein
MVREKVSWMTNGFEWPAMPDFLTAARLRSRAAVLVLAAALGAVAGCAADFVPRSAVPVELVSFLLDPKSQDQVSG